MSPGAQICIRTDLIVTDSNSTRQYLSDKPKMSSLGQLEAKIQAHLFMR